MFSRRTLLVAVGLALPGSVLSPRAAAQEPAPAVAPRSARSVLLITLDTTRRDYVGFMGRTPSPTPMLDHMAEVAIVFDDAMTTAPLTLPAHGSLLTGLYPANHGARDNALDRVPAVAHTLAEILREHGYATRASVAAFVLDPIFGLDQGFDRYRAPPRSAPRGGSSLPNELDARRSVDRAIEDLQQLARPAALASAPRPFFYWLHLFDPHSPYAAPDPPQLGADAAADPIGAIKAGYEAELRFADRELGRLFAALGVMQALEELVVVVASDHGESLRDAPEETHGFLLFDPTMRVPLFVRHPDWPAQRLRIPVSLVDVAPTLLAMLGIDAASERFDGIDLTPWMRDATRPPPDRPLMLESLCAWNTYGWAPLVGCTRAELKYVRSSQEALYDRAVDPLERDNRFRTDEPRAAALSRSVDRHLHSATPLARSDSGISEADRAKLRALGYAASGPGSALPEDWTTLADPLAKSATIDRFSQVFIAESKGDLGEAIGLLRALVVDEPRSSAVREQLGLLLLNAGPEHADEAAAVLDATLALDPRRARSWWARAVCAETQAARARAAAQAAREQGRRKEARPHVDAERAAHELAEAALRKSLECEPDYPDALQLLGRILTVRGEVALLRGEDEPARAAFTESLQILERLTAVLPPSAPEWAEAATMRERMKSRIARINEGS